MKKNITLTNDEIYTAIIALILYETLIANAPYMPKKNKAIEAARADALIDKLKKLVQVQHD